MSKFLAASSALILTLITLNTGCSDAPQTGTATAPITATGFCPVNLVCDESGACVLNVDIDEHGHFNMHDYVEFPNDEGDDWDSTSYLPIEDDLCDISNNWGKICSKKGKCPKGRALWCKIQTCLVDHGGILLPEKTQVECRNCAGGVNPNTSTNGCAPV